MNITPSCRAIDAVVASFVAALIISIIMNSNQSILGLLLCKKFKHLLLPLDQGFLPGLQRCYYD
jgi:hypothetical protein